MTSDARGPATTEVWMAWVRLAAVGFALLEVVVFKEDYPPGYEAWALAVTAFLAAGAVALLVLAYRASRQAWHTIGFGALAFDSAVAYGYIFVYAFDVRTVRMLVFVPLVEAAMRYGLRGGLAVPALSAVVLALHEAWRVDRFDPGGYEIDNVTFPVGVQLIVGVVVGSLVKSLRESRASAATRATEAEALRDELGRRADILDATNRCARALSSSLEINQAFAAFIRELRGLVPFDRTAIVLLEDGQLRVLATAGEAAETVFPPGTVRPIERSALSEVRAGETLYREEMTDRRFDEEDEFLALGLRSRVLVPLLSGLETIGALSVVRRDPSAFSSHEIELLGLLGRLAGTAVQNIRAYEAERTTAEELRRLSALRADFVSLVSHELRSPMASVIGSAETLKLRWRELKPEHRDSFLALISHETSRLAELIGDVLDTSRIEAGTFSYSFGDVDLVELVRDSAALAERTQDEVPVTALVREPLPHVRGDRDRLRQVLINLIDNAVKYSKPGEEVRVEAQSSNSRVLIEVHDQGPGIAPEHQRVIFEKFGRIQTAQAAKPGTGLGLFIARSIAEAHGGSLNVRSHPEQSGATFTLALPLGVET
jgi:signal transduction histidine kinase